MSSDTRNQLQSMRLRRRTAAWERLFRALGVDPAVAQAREDVQAEQKTVEDMSWQLWINEGF